MNSTAKIASTQGLLARWSGAFLALAIILVSKQCYNRMNPSRGHRQDCPVMNSTAKIALTQGLLALRSQALPALAIILVRKQCYNRKNPSRDHHQDSSVMYSSAKTAVTHWPRGFWPCNPRPFWPLPLYLLVSSATIERIPVGATAKMAQ